MERKRKFNAEYFIRANREFNKTIRFNHQPQYRETNGEHLCSLALLRRRLVCDELKLDIDYDKLDRMLIFHDYGEAGWEYDFEAVGYTAKETKDVLEKYNIQRITVLQKDPEILELWTEYNENKTKEARVAKALDKIDATIHKAAHGIDAIKNNAIFSVTAPNKYILNCAELIPFWADVQNEVKKQFIDYGYEWNTDWEINNQKGERNFIGKIEDREKFTDGLGI
jgi:5'-deoxynucleotidase YfbR-like HD superfamily hydrolase